MQDDAVTRGKGAGLPGLRRLGRERPSLEPWVRWAVAGVGALLIAAEAVMISAESAQGRPQESWGDSIVTLLCGLVLVGILAGPGLLAVGSVAVAALAVPQPTYAVLLLALPGLAFLCARYARWGVLVVFALGQGGAVVAATAVREDAGALLAVGLSGLVLGLTAGAASRILSVRLRQVRDDRARVVAASRRAVARDLHDVIAQNLAVIALQAEALPLQPEAQRQDTLELLARRARETHRDLRGLLDVLYASTGLDGGGLDGGGLDEGGLDHGPAATSGVLRLEESLEAVAGQLREDGFTVTLRSGLGDVSALPLSVHAAVHRIAQEAAANVRRHAEPGTAVEVTAEQDATGLRLRVVNDLPRDTAPTAGAGRDAAAGGSYGLTNVRERAALLGGHVVVGVQDGRWSLCVTLPSAPL